MEIFLPVAEEIGLSVVPVAEDEIVVEDEIRVMKEIDHYRRVVHRKKARRSRPAIYVLAPDVERRSERRPRLPVDGLFRSAGVPDYRLTFATQDLDHFFKQIA